MTSSWTTFGGLEILFFGLGLVSCSILSATPALCHYCLARLLSATLPATMYTSLTALDLPFGVCGSMLGEREVPVPFFCGPISSQTCSLEGYSPSGRAVYAGWELPATCFFVIPFLCGPFSLRDIKAASCNILNFCSSGRAIYVGWESPRPISSWTNFLAV